MSNTEVPASLRGDPHILVGDFNALARHDYGAKAWQDIADIRDRGGWEAPRSDLMEFVLSRAGYVDARESSLGHERKPLAPEDRVEGTCRYDTRIDFVLVRPGPSAAHTGAEGGAAAPAGTVGGSTCDAAGACRTTAEWQLSVVPGSYTVHRTALSDHELITVAVDIQRANQSRGHSGTQLMLPCSDGKHGQNGSSIAASAAPAKAIA